LFSDFDSGAGVKSAGRLIKDKHLGIVDQDARQAETLLHTAGKAVDRSALLGLKVGQLEYAFDDGFALLAFYAESCRKKLKVLKDFQIVVDTHKIGHVPDQPADLFAVLADVQPIDEGLAAGRFQESHQYPHGGSLAGTIRADETEYITFLNGQIEAGDGG
jgi:hypothetical protein